jgi:hypothetical protein
VSVVPVIFGDEARRWLTRSALVALAGGVLAAAAAALAQGSLSVTAVAGLVLLALGVAVVLFGAGVLTLEVVQPKVTTTPGADDAGFGALGGGTPPSAPAGIALEWAARLADLTAKSSAARTLLTYGFALVGIGLLVLLFADGTITLSLTGSGGTPSETPAPTPTG